MRTWKREKVRLRKSERKLERVKMRKSGARERGTRKSKRKRERVQKKGLKREKGRV